MPLIKELPELARALYDTEKSWRPKNWNKTIKTEYGDIEEVIKKNQLFDIWSNILQDLEVARKLLPEIIMDSYFSLNFTGYGLYKYAHMALRSELETTLRLVFFSTHQIEFEWWLDGNEWFRDNAMGDVWGKSYGYFAQLKTIKKFESLCENNNKLFGGKNVGIKGLYSRLSQFIHSGASSLQTSPERFSPIYNHNEFKEWYKTYIKVDCYINLILILGFSEQFKEITQRKKDKILNHGIDSYYKDKVERTFST